MKHTVILGNRVDAIGGYRQLYEEVLCRLKSQQHGSEYVTVNNVHTMTVGFWDGHYRNVINHSFLSLADGKPLQLVGRLKGHRQMQRLFGPTVMEKFLDWGRADGLRHFFFGSSVDCLQKISKAVEEKYPGAIICGMLSPPFAPMCEWDNENFANLINVADPDVVWVGLGAPKQEKWMFENQQRIRDGVLFGIGAGFSYLAGNTKHAPQWMKNFALEWLYRLIQEPRRLWKRDLATIPQFLVFASLELCGIEFHRQQSSTEIPVLK